MNISFSKIAVIHDWFINKSFGGAEKVTIQIDKLLKEKYSTPEIFSLTSNIKETEKRFLKGRKVKTSFIQSLPFGSSCVQKYLPLLPFAIEQMDFSEYELIISSSHAFAKGVLTSPNQLHISYVHTPMRYAWDQMNTYLKQSKLSRYGFSLPIRYSLFKLREWDFSSSQRIDFLVANSNFTAKRIKKYWGLDSKVIHPPVNIERFKHNQNREDFYISVNRLVPNKRIDLLVQAFNKLGLPLIIIGDGPERPKLKKIASPNIKFFHRLSNSEVESYMSRCRAFVYAGIEDFGIAPVEAMAAGCPVIALGKGGVLDTVKCLTATRKEKVATGILFKNQTSKDIIDTIEWFNEKKIWKEFIPETLNNYSKKFSPEIFNNKFELFLKQAWNKYKRNL